MGKVLLCLYTSAAMFGISALLSAGAKEDLKFARESGVLLVIGVLRILSAISLLSIFPLLFM